jgi:hypothetical protein
MDNIVIEDKLTRHSQLANKQSIDDVVVAERVEG